MLEWLVTIGATELGKAIFEQVLKLTQAAAEDYVKDFFKGCLKEGITAAKPEVAKKAVAGALQAFLLLVTDELEDQELSKAEIRDRYYEEAMAQFVKNDQVKPLLGQAFDKDCSAIDCAALATLWQQSTLRDKPFPAMPDDFDWQRVGCEYLKKVRRIVRETPELREPLKIELLENIARNTAQISPGFDVTKYRESLQSSYGYLKLSTIDTTDQQYRVKLWRMFIEQTVREALPPMRYELPLDLKRRLQAQGQLEGDLSSEALEYDRKGYFQQPSRKILAAVADSQQAVILGDPGAGKSTLLQYLALGWVEGKTESLPLLIELREYAISQSNNFFDFLHRGRGVDWQFDQQKLHQYLQEHPTLVMFDGLDEVFDRPTQAAISDDIIRFAQQYPKSQVLITSRIIGYSPERLQHAQFRHFTIQPLDTDEIHEFIDRWYTLALGNDPDKPRLVTRLKDAIANSKAIQNLADNPLLLTMIAILNRRQELPRDRADLYDQASRVLLHHWDVDHKKQNLPLDTIGRREKQEMLRLIAYEMQAGEEGLKGNLISVDRLTRILTDYLRDQGFGEPREKANKLIDQLRHRNFILCDRGADTYGFVHRTFLEYFCAVEIVNRFEKQRTLTFEQLRDEVFGNHWQDETWHEVLRLICGAIDANFAGALIEFLIGLEVDRSHFLESDGLSGVRLKPEGLMNLLLAADCSSEVHTSNFISNVQTRLLKKLQQEVEQPEILLGWNVARELLRRITQCFDPENLVWLKGLLLNQSTHPNIIWAGVHLLPILYDDPDTLAWLKKRVEQDTNWDLQWAASESIGTYFCDDPETLSWLKVCVQQAENPKTRFAAVDTLARHYPDDSETYALIQTCVYHDENEYVRSMALTAIALHFPTTPGSFQLMCNGLSNDASVCQGILIAHPRKTVLQALLTHYPTHPKTLELLRGRAENDPDEQLRQWAQEQLERIEGERQ